MNFVKQKRIKHQVPLPPTYLPSQSVIQAGARAGAGQGRPVQYVCYGKIVAGIYIDTYLHTWYVSAVAKFDEKS